MKTTKNTYLPWLIVILLCLSIRPLRSQTVRETQSNKELEVSLGLSVPQLYGGQALMASAAVRNEGYSYYQSSNGTRKKVGSYPQISGWVLAVSYAKQLKENSDWWFGASVRSSLGGTEPETGAYAEGYFFNHLSASTLAKFKPVWAHGFSIKAEAGMSSVFTKNRYIKSNDTQGFLHQFGIGYAAGAAIQYQFKPVKSWNSELLLSTLYQYNSTRVEVEGIGDDNWIFGSLQLSGGLIF